VGPITLLALEGLPEIEPGADLAQVVIDALARSATTPVAGDVLVFAQKVVSKAENAIVDLNGITPGERAREIAVKTLKDPRIVELILSESTEILRAVPNVLIVRHRLGYVSANAGIDRSNVPSQDGKDLALLLPADPDRSAQMLRDRLTAAFDAPLAVVISDSFGRPWRMGTTNIALGCAGLPSLSDQRGQQDRNGRVLEATQVALGDAIASAAGLAMGEGAESTPVVLVRGLHYEGEPRNGAALIRPIEQDLFR
jgi:coenzyme F420-0:L-glutamate ligase/coenzyme F420-1:gamma-L-glutamate ligase